MMNVEAEIHNLLKEVGPGQMSNNAYDTSWVARMGDLDRNLSNHAMGWLSENQLEDGSWGAKDTFYYHDRVICTLGAMIALTQRGRRAQDKVQIENGLRALEWITSGATRGLAADPNGATVGFEMIVPTLVTEAEKLGIIKQQGERILGRLQRFRTHKLSKLSGKKINKYITPAFSSEMVGVEGKALLDIDNLQESNGSIGNSPSATAFFAMHLKPNDLPALEYIRKWVDEDGGVPNVAPFDIFEPAWALWNLQLIPDLSESIISAASPHLDYLQNHWDDKRGIGHASEYTPKDSDDSGLVYELLVGFNRQVDINAVLGYEEPELFRCFELEANPSISANIHVLGALRAAGYEAEHPSVQKILKFLETSQTDQRIWFDKWHASPYYATAHGVILGQAYAKSLFGPSVKWIMDTQKEDGSWGFYKSTAEETAYSLQALCVWKRNGGNVPRGQIKRGLAWLEEHAEPSYEPLWIGKALYAPRLVVRATILSAIALAREE